MRSLYKKRFLYLLVVLVVLFVSCNSRTGNKTVGNEGVEDTVQKQVEEVIPGKETVALLSYLEEMGDWVNSRQFPSLIKASSVYESLEGNILLIDIRDADSFNSGHISGAVNKSFNDLPEYFESGIKPFEYERIIIISENGQDASYTTSLLRLMGYGNVFALRWGMSGWSYQYAEKGWLAGCSSSFEERIETDVNPRPAANEIPELNTGFESGEGIASARFAKLFSEGLDGVSVTATEVFDNPEGYYIINYDRRDKYESGHIPGAVRYKPGATLSMINEMATIPTGKPVVVYCGTGHNSGFVTAYLRLFGYDAHTLRFGNNSFMYNKMKEDKKTLSWLPFTLSESSDYEVVK